MGTWLTEINIHEKLCVKLVIYKDHTRMHGQQNIKCCSFVFIDIARTVLAEVLFRVHSFFVAAVFMYQDLCLCLLCAC